MNKFRFLITQKPSKLVTEMFVALLPAQIFAAMTASFSSIINGLVIGNCLSRDAMVALGFVTPVTLILGAISAVISGGARVLFGRYIGRADREKLNEVFTVAVSTAIFAGLCCTLICLFFSKQLAYVLGARNFFIDRTALYIDGLAIGILPTIVAPLLMVFLQLTERATYAFISTIVLAGGNLFFGLISIKLLHGDIFEMGLATTASQYITLLFLLVKFIGKDAKLRFDGSKFTTIMARKLCIMGSPAALCVIFYAIRNIVLNNIAFNTAGDVAVSAMAIVTSAIGPIDAINTGIGSVGIILTALYIGEKDKTALNNLYYVIIRIGVFVSIGQMLFILIFGRPISALFGAEGEVLKQAYHLFLGFAATKIPYSIALASVSMMQSIGMIKQTNVYFFFVALLSPVGLATMFSQLIGITGVWISYVGSELVGIAIISAWNKLKLRGSESNVQESFFIRDSMFKGRQMTITINNAQEMLNVSERIIAFCKENGIDERRSNMSGLCLEEIGMNIIDEGFGKKNYIDFFIDVEDSYITLRLRNNAKKNNPFKSFSPYNPKDPCKNIGVRMVQAIAKEIDYKSTFGMNVLIMKL